MAKAVKCLLSTRINSFSKVCFKSISSLIKMENSDSSHCSHYTYQEAIEQLNRLQSNLQVLNAARVDKDKTALASLPLTKRALIGIGVELEELDTLSIIHVAGSKGKGMTCAFTESILRQAGLRTGFFSSPHLRAARERIRINGQPLTETQFAQYFFTAFNKLKSVTENPSDLPGYFRFLTCMAFYVFLKEKVDVAVVEVGIGGLHDSTNIIRKPVVVGITSLGLEHQFLLGNTLEEIAMNKAGIMKENVPAFTVHSHPSHILQVLKERSVAYKCSLLVAPPLESYAKTIQLGVDDGVVSRINASLAIQLVTSFLKSKFPHKLQSNDDQSALSTSGNVVDTNLLECHMSGLKNAKWNGRFQTVRANENLTYFVDGAHTEDSLSVALNWYISKTTDNSFRVLIFHLTGDRKAEDLIKPFANGGEFHLAIFCPLVVSNPYSSNAGSVDNWSALSSEENLMQKCDKHKRLWLSLTSDTSEALVCPNVDSTLKFLERLSFRQMGSDQNDNQDEQHTTDHSVDNLLAISKGKRVDVLVTGSLHLVGTFLSVLDPEQR